MTFNASYDFEAAKQRRIEQSQSYSRPDGPTMLAWKAEKLENCRLYISHRRAGMDETAAYEAVEAFRGTSLRAIEAYDLDNGDSFEEILSECEKKYEIER